MFRIVNIFFDSFKGQNNMRRGKIILMMNGGI